MGPSTTWASMQANRCACWSKEMHGTLYELPMSAAARSGGGPKLQDLSRHRIEMRECRCHANIFHADAYCRSQKTLATDGSFNERGIRPGAVWKWRSKGDIELPQVQRGSPVPGEKHRVGHRFPRGKNRAGPRVHAPPQREPMFGAS